MGGKGGAESSRASPLSSTFVRRPKRGRLVFPCKAARVQKCGKLKISLAAAASSSAYLVSRRERAALSGEGRQGGGAKAFLSSDATPASIFPPPETRGFCNSYRRRSSFVSECTKARLHSRARMIGAGGEPLLPIVSASCTPPTHFGAAPKSLGKERKPRREKTFEALAILSRELVAWREREKAKLRAFTRFAEAKFCRRKSNTRTNNRIKRKFRGRRRPTELREGREPASHHKILGVGIILCIGRLSQVFA